jgi:RNA chaperone Hfq
MGLIEFVCNPPPSLSGRLDQIAGRGTSFACIAITGLNVAERSTAEVEMSIDDREGGSHARAQRDRRRPGLRATNDGYPADPGGTHLEASESPRRAANSAQDPALAKWTAERCNLTIYLRNSIGQRGVVVGWDQFSIMLEVGGGVVESIQKTAILSIIPSRPNFAIAPSAAPSPSALSHEPKSRSAP